MTYGQYITLLYKVIYLIIVALITIVWIAKYYKRGANNVSTCQTTTIPNNTFIFFLAIALALFIGLRPHQGFGDSTNYVHMYEMREGLPFTFEWDVDNLVWDNLFNWWAAYDIGIGRLFLLVAFCYFILTLIACKRLFGKDASVAFLVFLGAFSTFSYATNGIKAGLAATLFLLGLSFRDQVKIAIPIVLISYGFHHSMQLPVVAFIITLFIKNPKWYFRGWLFCALMAILHVNYFQDIFASITDESGATYLMNDGEFVFLTGFRPDFILYSAMPVLSGYYAVYKKKLEVSKTYLCLLNTYLCINSVWMLCIYASYTNRIAYLSWCIYPIVLIYPVLKENWGPYRYRTFTKVALCHLAFTLFMEFIYYGLLPDNK